jgi:DNA polymerase-3 subunit gamma/tau
MSDTYKALTRKYRPRTFEDIVSQEHVSNTLRNAIEQKRLNHAYLFSGPRGVGKTTMARVLARMINGIDDSVDGEALGSTLDIIEFDAASNNGVEDVHRVRDSVRVPPQKGIYKVFIIDEVHMLSKQAFNALLKTLEEPPSYVVFIFATTEPHKVLPTILSRCQRFDFRRIKVGEIVERLRHICKEEGITIDDESLHVIASKADGALRDALSLMDQVIAFCGVDITHELLIRALNVVSQDTLFDIVDAIRDHDASRVLGILDALMLQGNDMQELLIALTETLRNLYMARDAKNLYLVEATDETKRRLIAASKAFSEEDVLRMMHLVSEAQFKIRDAAQPRIQVELALLKLTSMPRAKGLSELMEALRQAPTAPKGTASVPSPSVPSSQGSTPSTPTSTPTSTPPAPPPPSSALFGAPAIKRPTNALRSVNLDEETPLTSGKIEGGLALAAQPEALPEAQLEPDPEPEPLTELYLSDVRTVWSQYIEEVKKACKMSISHSLIRSQPTDLKGELLTIECDDEFSRNILQTNQRDLVACWKPVVGRMLSLEFTLNAARPKVAQEDPYSRFRKMQQEDPKLKLIVDVFGAELEY